MEKIDYIKNSACLSKLKYSHSLFRVSATLNPYIGCSSNCIYCPFTMGNRVGVKTDYLHFLEKCLSESTEKIPLGFGSMCEPYNNLEKAHHLTRYSMEIITKYKHPVQIFTKSELILDDMEFLKKYSQEGLLAVSISFSSADSGLSKKMEPEANTIKERLSVLKELKKNNVFAGAVLAPIIPFVNDSLDSLEELFDLLSGSCEYLLPQALSLDSSALKDKINDFVSKEFPEQYSEFLKYYEGKIMPDTAYAQNISDTLSLFSKKYDIPLFLPLHAGESSSFDINQELLR